MGEANFYSFCKLYFLKKNRVYNCGVYGNDSKA